MTKYGVLTFGISKVAISQNRPCQISPFQWLVLSSRRPGPADHAKICMIQVGAR